LISVQRLLEKQERKRSLAAALELERLLMPAAREAAAIGTERQGHLAVDFPLYWQAYKRQEAVAYFGRRR
jgi:hypothetical protein